MSHAISPGAVITWRGRGDVRVTINGRPAAKLRESPDEVWYQAPSDLPVGSTALVEVDSGSPLLSEYRRIAAHADFRGLVTLQDPAEPGEIVHLWAVGLGPLSGGKVGSRSIVVCFAARV
jgi:hypothetical protein